jgi:hypothetical protein
MTTQIEIFEAALDNYKSNVRGKSFDSGLTAQYFVEYAENALNQELTQEQAAKMVNLAKEIEEMNNSNDRFHAVQTLEA